jgi:thiol-disulfide isomerase/thioredoxin
MMIERKEYARALGFADRGRSAATRFMNENESAYLMVGKFRNARARSTAAWLVIRGTVALQRMDFSQAESLLEEADRLTHGQDAAAQTRLGDLAMARKDLDRAQEHYVNALSLTGASAPLRTHATQALMGIRASLEDSAGFDVWLEETVSRRRDERRTHLVRSVVEHPLPPLRFTALDGRPMDVSALKNKVLVLNFFNSWCGACRSELPHLTKVYAKYESDPSVAFLLVSLDTDMKRLQRYLDEQQFPMPVARAAQAAMEQAMGFDDVPATFYVDRQGVVRYETRGVETHGDSAARVSWYIEALKTTQ